MLNGLSFTNKSTGDVNSHRNPLYDLRDGLRSSTGILSCMMRDPWIRDEMPALPRIIDTFKESLLGAPSLNGLFERYSYDLVDLGDRFQLSIELPGAKKENIRLEWVEDVIKIEAQISRTYKEEDIKESLYASRAYSKIERQIAVPKNIDWKGSNAEYVDGILTLTIPKKEVDRSRRIEIK